MQTIAIVNQKGGVGKSTTAVNLGAGLVRQGKRVLLIDADSQANLTEMLGWQQPDELSPTLATMLERIISDRPIEPQNGILHHKEGMDLLPANIELSGLEVSLVNTMSRETVLRTYLNEVKRQYESQFVFCESRLGDEGGGIVNGELINRKFDKGTGIKAICGFLGCSLADTIGFGDSDNDLQMTDVVGISVCMANGSDNLKKRCDRICPAVSEDGVAKEFAELGLI